MSGILNKLAQLASKTLAGWLETYAWIVDKAGATIRPKANPLQTEISEAIDWCEQEGRPVRLIILKPRQKGCSTISVGALFRFLKIRKLRACIIGAGFKQSGNLFKILKTYAKHDTWKQGGKCTVLKDIARWGNGSECDRLTANDPEAGRSGTYQVILATEVARWSEDGVANASEVLSGLLKTVGNEPTTVVIFETTAAGAYGDYYERYQKAVTLEEAKAGKPGYIKIFMPWFVFDDSRRKPSLEQITDENDLTTHELEYMQEWELDLWQIAWMRWALREECNGDWDRFQQDYPSDEETAFLKSGRARFSATGMKYQDKIAKTCVHTFGSIDRQADDQINWAATDEKEAMWMRWEAPVEGKRYLVSVDQMTGANQTGGKDPDSHGVKVIRAGYTDTNGRWHPPATAMTLMLMKDGELFKNGKPNKDGQPVGNWMDIDVLTEHVHRASLYYGNCLIVPEVNMDRGMIELLKLKSANIYTRQIYNKRTSEYMDAYGWNTNKQTRAMMIENMARAIRELPKRQEGEGFEIRCPWTIDEAKSFIRKENGREEAAPGSHDDQIISAMIGLMVIDSATTYFKPRVSRYIPPDLRPYEDYGSGSSSHGGTFGI